jgi:hypothetical protein
VGAGQQRPQRRFDELGHRARPHQLLVAGSIADLEMDGIQRAESFLEPGCCPSPATIPTPYTWLPASSTTLLARYFTSAILRASRLFSGLPTITMAPMIHI